MMKIKRLLLLLVFCAVSLFDLAAEDYFIHSFTKLHLTDKFYSEGAHFGDFNKDGKGDVVSGSFWFQGPDFKTAHEYFPSKPFNPKGYSDKFFAFVDDFNQDGWDDILIYGFPGKDASWFENPQENEGHWKRHNVLGVVDNESPTWLDLTGDGRSEIVCSSGGFFGFASPNWDDPTKPWAFRKISTKVAGGRFTHGLGVGDVNGDGRMDILERNGWWEQPESLEGDPIWKQHKVRFGGGGAQMFAYDIDGDGDNDVVTSLAAHAWGLAWFEQVKKEDGTSSFKQHLILGSKGDQSPYGLVISQMHAIDCLDMDGDGLKDIVTGKRFWAHNGRDPGAAMPAVLYWFRLVRRSKGAAGVDFVPYLIDNDSGVGTQVTTGDVNGDGLPDVVVGNKKGTFIHLQSKKKATQKEWKKVQPWKSKDRAAGLQPDEAAAAITVPGGFNVKLIAGEPQVHQPIAFTIDERGRIWVAEAHAYPRRQPTGKGKDKIVVFEDTDGDGSFESSKVFVDNLNLVSGLEVGFGGVWVGAPPYLMFIPDADGDAVPDGVPKILLDGWGYQDTHELLNSFIWGPDGWLYGCQGIFTHSNIGKPGTPPEERIPMNCGVWRYHPTKHQFEVFAWGTSNPWGVDFDDHGQAFLTACVIPHLFHLIQGARYQRQTGRHFNPHVYEVIKTIADHLHFAGGVGEHAWWGRDAPVRHATTDKAGGGHAHCGAMIYLGDSFPEQYRNTFFTNNIHGNRVNNDVLKRKGSGYIGSHGKDFLLANDHWFRGINLKYGPDGSVYLIDWYDKNACHRVNPAIWDRTNGRIYKVGFGESKPVKVNLAALTDKELVQLHLHRNDWYVRTARRVLQQRAAEGDIEKETSASLYRILENNPEVSRKLRALWTLHATNALNEDTAAIQLSSGEEFIRAWVIQLLCEDGMVSEEIASKLGELSKTDPSPTVRLYLASALQRLPLDQRWPIAEGLLGRAEDANDRNLPLMVWYGIEPLVTHDPARALSLIKSSKLPKIPGHLARRAAADPKARTALLASLAEADGADQFMILEETVKAIRNTRRIPMPAGWPGIYKKLMQSKNKTIRHNAQYVTIKFGDKQIYPILRKLVAQKLADLEDRRQALKALLGGRDPMLPGVLFELLDEPALRIQALRGLAEFGDEKTPEAILSRYKKFSTAEQSTAISTLSTRPKFALALLSAIEKWRSTSQCPLRFYSATDIEAR